MKAAFAQPSFYTIHHPQHKAFHIAIGKSFLKNCPRLIVAVFHSNSQTYSRIKDKTLEKQGFLSFYADFVNECATFMHKSIITV